MDYRKLWDLGDLLNEFVDEYTVLFEAAHLAYTQGLTFRAQYENDKIIPLVEQTPFHQYLNPIDRISQMSYWLSGDLEIYTTKTFNDTVKNFNLSKLHKTSFFIGDEVTISFIQEQQLLAKITGTVAQGNWFGQYATNKKIRPLLGKGLLESQSLLVKVQLTKPSEHRVVIQQQFGQAQHDLFLQYLVHRELNVPFSMNYSLEEIKTLPLVPKRVNTLHSLIMNKKELLRILKNGSTDNPFVLPPEDERILNIIKNKLLFYQKNRVPFTKNVE